MANMTQPEAYPVTRERRLTKDSQDLPGSFVSGINSSLLFSQGKRPGPMAHRAIGIPAELFCGLVFLWQKQKDQRGFRSGKTL
jgi:hypothetical protein